MSWLLLIKGLKMLFGIIIGVNVIQITYIGFTTINTCCCCNPHMEKMKRKIIRISIWLGISMGGLIILRLIETYLL